MAEVWEEENNNNNAISIEGSPNQQPFSCGGYVYNLTKRVSSIMYIYVHVYVFTKGHLEAKAKRPERRSPIHFAPGWRRTRTRTSRLQTARVLDCIKTKLKKKKKVLLLGPAKEENLLMHLKLCVNPSSSFSRSTPPSWTDAYRNLGAAVRWGIGFPFPAGPIPPPARRGAHTP